MNLTPEQILQNTTLTTLGNLFAIENDEHREKGFDVFTDVLTHFGIKLEKVNTPKPAVKIEFPSDLVVTQTETEVMKEVETIVEQIEEVAEQIVEPTPVIETKQPTSIPTYQPKQEVKVEVEENPLEGSFSHPIPEGLVVDMNTLTTEEEIQIYNQKSGMFEKKVLPILDAEAIEEMGHKLAGAGVNFQQKSREMLEMAKLIPELRAEGLVAGAFFNLKELELGKYSGEVDIEIDQNAAAYSGSVSLIYLRKIYRRVPVAELSVREIKKAIHTWR